MGCYCKNEFQRARLYVKKKKPKMAAGLLHMSLKAWGHLASVQPTQTFSPEPVIWLWLAC